MKGKYVYALLVAAGGVGVLYLIMWQAGLGEFAQSPQRVVVRRDATKLVAGGKAGLVYEGRISKSSAKVLVRCHDRIETLRLEVGVDSEELCGVRVRLLEASDQLRATVEVRWGE